MNENEKKLSDKIWQGEPLPEDFISRFPRPSEETRKEIFMAARNQSEKLNNRNFISKLIFGHRSILSYSAITVAAATIIFCVFVPKTIKISEESETQNQNWEIMVRTATTISEESKISLLTDPSGVDIDEDIFAIELFLLGEEVSSLENEKWCDITFKTKGQL